jgi:hypothetical protein
VSQWTRDQEEADPFVRDSVASLQPVAHHRKWARHILSTTCAPIDWIGFDRKAGLQKTPIARGM